MRRFFADTTPLRSPDFRRLWLAGIVTVIGANLTIFAVPVQLYALTQSSAYVGLSGLFALVPLVVFGLWGGAWADAMDRRLLLIIASCGLALASVLLWLHARSGGTFESVGAHTARSHQPCPIHRSVGRRKATTRREDSHTERRIFVRKYGHKRSIPVFERVEGWPLGSTGAGSMPGARHAVLLG